MIDERSSPWVLQPRFVASGFCPDHFDTVCMCLVWPEVIRREGPDGISELVSLSMVFISFFVNL